MPRSLPEHPNLEHLRNQAKALLRELEARNPDALERYRTLLSKPAPPEPKLADAQRALAREYGFASWPRLRSHVESVSPGSDAVEVFVAAVNANDTAQVRRVLARHPQLKGRLNDPLPGFAFGATALLAALPSGNREMLELLLDAGADVNQKSHWWAGGFGVLDGDRSLAGFLIERGARVDAHAAAHLGRVDILRRLVAADPGVVHARGGDGQTPLHVADSVEIAAFLLDHGADVDALDVDHESTPAQYMARGRQDVARYLVARGARTDVLMASALGDLERVRRHLDAAPECVRTEVSERWFPKRDPRSGGSIYLWVLGAHKSAAALAREFGHEHVVQLLLERSPDELKLGLACELGEEEMLRGVLAARPDLPAALSADDRKKLVFAAQHGNIDAVRMMLAAGWPLDARGQHGGTALHWAAWQGNAAIVRELLRHRPDLEALDDDFGASPLGWAIHGSENRRSDAPGDHVGAVQALLEAGARAPKLAPDANGSEAVRAVLRRWLA